MNSIYSVYSYHVDDNDHLLLVNGTYVINGEWRLFEDDNGDLKTSSKDKGPLVLKGYIRSKHYRYEYNEILEEFRNGSRAIPTKCDCGSKCCKKILKWEYIE